MHPGSQVCPPGWSLLYAGYLMGTQSSQTKSELVCVDRLPEGLGPVFDNGGGSWFLTEAQCGSLPCPPYVQNREVTCSVCAR